MSGARLAMAGEAGPHPPREAGIAGLAPRGVLLDLTDMAVGDEHALLPGEAASFDHADVMVRRQSGAARGLARRLLAVLGARHAMIGRSPSRAPIWPSGFVGSLAHDASSAAAAVARRSDIVALGIDMEPNELLPAQIAGCVATPTERRRHAPAVLASRALFVAKEAVFKAVYPLDGVFLDFTDIEVDLMHGVAETATGRSVRIAVASSRRHIVALAHIAA